MKNTQSENHKTTNKTDAFLSQEKINHYAAGIVSSVEAITKKALAKGKYTVASLTIKAGGHLVLNKDEETNERAILADKDAFERGMKKLGYLAGIGAGIFLGMTTVNGKEVLSNIPNALKDAMEQDIPAWQKGLTVPLASLQSIANDAFKTPLVSRSFSNLENIGRLAVFSLVAKNGKSALSRFKKVLTFGKNNLSKETKGVILDAALDCVEKASDFMEKSHPETFLELSQEAHKKASEHIYKHEERKRKDEEKEALKSIRKQRKFVKIASQIASKNPLTVISRKREQITDAVIDKINNTTSKIEKKIDNGLDNLFNKMNNRKGR